MDIKIKTTIIKFLGLLNQHKKLIEGIFYTKESITTSQILAYDKMDSSTLENLISHGVLSENHGFYSLDTRIYGFLEDFLEIGEISVAAVRDKIDRLQTLTKYYEEDPNNTSGVGIKYLMV